MWFLGNNFVERQKYESKVKSRIDHDRIRRMVCGCGSWIAVCVKVYHGRTVFNGIGSSGHQCVFLWDLFLDSKQIRVRCQNYRAG